MNTLTWFLLLVEGTLLESVEVCKLAETPELPKKKKTKLTKEGQYEQRFYLYRNTKSSVKQNIKNPRKKHNHTSIINDHQLNEQNYSRSQSTSLPENSQKRTKLSQGLNFNFYTKQTKEKKITHEMIKRINSDKYMKNYTTIF